MKPIGYRVCVLLLLLLLCVCACVCVCVFKWKCMLVCFVISVANLLLPVLKKVSSFGNDRVSSFNNETFLASLPEEPPNSERQRPLEGGEKEGGALPQRRNNLPCPVPDMADFSLWSILRKNIGK